jgi:hypothetical protein
MSWIYNMNSGTPANLTSTAMAYNNNEPWIIDGASFNNEGTVDWPDGATVAGFWAEPGSYSRVLDPQCTDPAIVAPSLQGQCNRNAIQDSAGNLIFRTPLPGQAGNYRDQLRNPGSWTLDMAVSKRIQIREDISMDVRMDATNIFNHPTPANPNVAVQGGGDEFGTIDTKNGSRIFQLKARIDF